jgi:phage repressor protein C with HTH and peptisase S24 domain
MENKTPSGYSKRIREVREALTLKIAEFARSLNVPRSTLIGWEEGKAVSIETVKSLENIFGVNSDWYLTGEGEMFAQKPATANVPGRIPVYFESDIPEGSFVVPLLDQRLSAGNGSFLPEEDVALALIRVPNYLSRYGNKIAALTVNGDSMHPTLSRGDMVVCDSFGWSGEGIYALRISGDGFVKRLSKRPGKLVIISDNPKYPLQEESEGNADIEIIGRVRCAIREMD